MVITQPNPENTTIILKPNQSANMRQTKLLIIAITLIVLIIGLAWSFAGAYLVLPFAGLDIGLFAYFMYKVCDDTYEKQVVTIDNARVQIQTGKHCVERTIKLDRSSTYIIVVEPDFPNNTIGLNLTDSKSRFELGAFLNNRDKSEARRALKEAGLREISDKWWRPTP